MAASVRTDLVQHYSITFSIPGTLAAKRFPPSRTIAAGALGTHFSRLDGCCIRQVVADFSSNLFQTVWSIGATCQAAVTSPGGLYACRLVVYVGIAPARDLSDFFDVAKLTTPSRHEPQRSRRGILRTGKPYFTSSEDGPPVNYPGDE